jgi:hypothetical protein
LENNEANYSKVYYYMPEMSFPKRRNYA